MNFLLIVGSSRLEDLGPFQKRACNHNMRLPGDSCQGAILGPKTGWTRLSRPFVPVGVRSIAQDGVSLHPPGRASPDPSSRWGYEASLKTGFHFTRRPLGCTGEAYYLS